MTKKMPYAIVFYWKRKKMSMPKSSPRDPSWRWYLHKTILLDDCSRDMKGGSTVDANTLPLGVDAVTVWRVRHGVTLTALRKIAKEEAIDVDYLFLLTSHADWAHLVAGGSQLALGSEKEVCAILTDLIEGDR